jgi:hypothetical protein
MYSRAGEFRIDLVTFDSEDHAHPRNPTALAVHAAPGPASLLGGSDHWRPGPSSILRAHIDDLARYACHETRASTVEITLHERIVGGAERATRQRLACTP